MIGFYLHPKDSENVVHFIQREYADLKRLNPLMSILVRDSPQVTDPYVIAYYDYAAMEKRELKGLSVEEIQNVVKELVELGEKMPKFPQKEFFDIKRDDEPEMKGLLN